MSILNFQHFNFKHLSILKNNNNLGFFPIKYKNNNIIIKSPNLILPNGIYKSRFNNKQYCNFQFPNIFTNKHIEFYKLLKNLDKFLNNNVNNLLRYINKVKKQKQEPKVYKKQVNVKSCINLNMQEPIFKMSLFKNAVFYDKDNQEININQLKDYINCRILFNISGIWFNNNNFGLLIYCLQLKKIPKQEKCFLEDTLKTINIQNDNNCKQNKKIICCPHCNETINLLIKNINRLEKKLSQLNTNNNINHTNYDPNYNKYIKMHKVGVPLVCIKQKIGFEGLDFTIFESILKGQTNTSSSQNNTNNTNDADKFKQRLKFNLGDLLNQKNKLKKAKKRKHKPIKTKFQPPKNNKLLVPTLDDILNTLKSLKSVKRNF